MADKYQFMLLLAKKGAMYSTVPTSTCQIAQELDVSQQTVSRKLIELEEEGLVKRAVSPSGITLSLTEKSRRELKNIYSELKGCFEKRIQLKGKVVSGINQGAYYVKIFSHYFKKYLGITPYLGTINFEIDEDKKNELLSRCKEVFIPGFKKADRTFGWVKCYPVNLNEKEKIWITVPERTLHNKGVIEAISPYYLRKRLKLKDDDMITLRVD